MIFFVKEVNLSTILNPTFPQSLDSLLNYSESNRFRMLVFITVQDF